MSEFDTFLQAIETQTHAAPSKKQKKPRPTIDQQEMVSPSEAYGRFWSKWTFKGRASRSEYWWVMLINNVIYFFLYLIPFNPLAFMLLFALLAFMLIGFIPGLCLTVRRLHDTGLSGWFAWFLLIPFVGPIVLFGFCCLGSVPCENDYGPIPNTRS